MTNLAGQAFTCFSIAVGIVAFAVLTMIGLLQVMSALT